MITARGTIPFPWNANAAPVRALAANLQRFSAGMQQASAQMTSTANTAMGSWQGTAASQFTQHMSSRARTAAMVGTTMGRAAPVLHAYAAQITASCRAYSIAARAEKAARMAFPISKPAILAAQVAQGAAGMALQAAGTACGAQIGMIIVEVAAAEYLGVSREMFNSIAGGVTQIFESAWEFVSEGDPDALIRMLNTTVEIPTGNGSQRVNILGAILSSQPELNAGVQIIQGGLALFSEFTQPELTATDRPDLLETLQRNGYEVGTTGTVGIGNNEALLEDLRRSRSDQSVLVGHTYGTDSQGRGVLTLTLPGIVPPNESEFNNTGTRNVWAAAGSQITGTGNEEDAIYRWIQQQGLRRGDAVNLFAHSQGGIVSRNVANRLIRDGYQVNVVAYGSPDGQFSEGVRAFVAQNDRDPVPVGRLGGAGGVIATLRPNQQIITFDHEVEGDLFAAHDPRVYGRQLAQQRPDTQALHAFLRTQSQVRLDPSRSGVVAFEGPRTPSGRTIQVGQPNQPYAPLPATPVPVPTRP
jgi:hypothetical protein